MKARKGVLVMLLALICHSFSFASIETDVLKPKLKAVLIVGPVEDITESYIHDMEVISKFLIEQGVVVYM